MRINSSNLWQIFYLLITQLQNPNVFEMSILQRSSLVLLNGSISFGPFNCHVQRRWKKPIDSARTRLENRTRDHTLDKLSKRIKKLKIVLRMHELMLQRRAAHTSVQLLSRWRNAVGLNAGIGSFIGKHPNIFEVYAHPIKRNLCCRISRHMLDLIADEALVVRESEMDIVQRLKKLLMMSSGGRLHAHALWLVRAEFGLPDDFRESIISKHPENFVLVHPDTVELVDSDDILPSAEIEKWRESQYTEKWLAESETKFAFPIQLPTGFKIEKGYREYLRNWQRMPYHKPYDKEEVICIRSRGANVERFEKHAVGILHEFLSLSIEKMVDVERLSHFRKDFSMTVNIRELLLKHPGIFYISTKGNSPVVFLREKYAKGLLEPNPLYIVRRKMLELVMLKSQCTHKMQSLKETNL